MATEQVLEVTNEDTIQCNFFHVSSKAEDLPSISDSVNSTIQNLSAGYIWHQDQFKVHIPIHGPQYYDLPAHLISSTCCGGNIEDEWFIVYLVLEMTKQNKDLVVQIFDNDGDILLIESADVLPSWANPENTENRVFIYQNRIHLIPPSIVDLDTDLKLNDAIKIIVANPDSTNSPEIYEAIHNRISEYPDKINHDIHKAILKLPIDIAALLALKPSLISPITNTYCNHDVIEAKMFKNVKFEDCVITQVKFTKCLYAMLLHSKLTKNVRHTRVKENDKKSALGLKLTCGYAIIMSKLTGDIFLSKEFNNFITSLTDNGYFRGNLEGSKDYKQLLDNAKHFFLNMESPIKSQVGNCIKDLMCTEEFKYIKEKLKKDQCIEDNLSESNDDWLNVNPDELNDLLHTQYGKPPKFKNMDIIDSQKITSELSTFLKQTSDFEGIESKETDDSEDEKIEFDSEQFMNSLKNMMNIVAGDNSKDLDLDSDDFSDVDEDITEEQDFYRDLEATLNIKDTDSEPVLQNIVQSLKEEESASGPSSNLLRTIGINKVDLLKFQSKSKN